MHEDYFVSIWFSHVTYIIYLLVHAIRFISRTIATYVSLLALYTRIKKLYLYIHSYDIYICLHVLYIHVHVIYRLLYAPNINIPTFIVHAICERVAVLLRLMVENILDMHMLYYIIIIQSNINVHVVHVTCDTSIFHCMYSISYVY